jgi:aspartyl protease family protein
MIPFRARAYGRAAWLILLFWVSIFAVVYLAMNITQGPNVARATSGSAANGEIVIPRSRDGHYYVAGSINSTPVTFLVDTGATVTAVGPDAARRARLSGGSDARIETAGGPVVGTMVAGATIVAGGIRVDDVRVAVLRSMPEGHALLGQNFLQYVTIDQRGDQLILRVPRGR